MENSFVNRFNKVCDLLDRVTYKPGWTFDVFTVADSRAIAISVGFSALDTNTNVLEKWNGRQWLIGDHMNDSDIIRTAFLAVKTAETHEMLEFFKLDNKIVFDPHWDVEQLVRTDVPAETHH